MYKPPNGFQNKEDYLQGARGQSPSQHHQHSFKRKPAKAAAAWTRKPPRWLLLLIKHHEPSCTSCTCVLNKHPSTSLKQHEPSLTRLFLFFGTNHWPMILTPPGYLVVHWVDHDSSSAMVLWQQLSGVDRRYNYNQQGKPVGLLAILTINNYQISTTTSFSSFTTAKHH